MSSLRSLAATALAAGVLFAGCGKSDQQTKLEQAADAANKAAETAAGNAAGGAASGQAQSGEHKPVPAVDYKKLQSYLPTSLSGWTAGKVDGATLNMDQWNYSTASIKFTNGDAEVTATIFDYAYIESLMQVYKMKFQFENEDGYAKTGDMAGFPGWETWQKNNNSATCVALLGDRFVVAVEGHGVKDASVPRSVLTGMNLKEIATLK